eukprot:TRINITY_DN1806_c0_g1_i4.p1 TRINITY_DN1806_c0_g1~~TRINITY_DN1806_c0_g1_i4.p1  ORF type:complete len:157 (-),score=11.15 TRINITY_DN1806_c0_g1_i4:182-652(-)
MDYDTLRALVWATLFFISVIEVLLTLYMYTAHEAMERGDKSPIDATANFTLTTPWEISISFALVVLFVFQRSYVLTILCLPLALYNLQVLLERKYKVYALFMKDYKDFETNIKRLRLKCGMYMGLMFILVVRFMICLLNLVIKKFSTNDYFSEWLA